MKVHAEYQDKTMQEVFAKIQTLASEMDMYTQNLKRDDEQTAENLADFVQRLSQTTNTMVDKVQRVTINQDGQAKQTKQQVVLKLNEMRAKLEQATNLPVNTQQRLSKMKYQINDTMVHAATCMQMLMQVAQQSQGQEGQGMKTLCKNVMMDCMAAGKTMQVELKMMAEQN